MLVDSGMVVVDVVDVADGVGSETSTSALACSP